MKYELYAIYDKVAGTISAPFLAINEETAKRNLRERQKVMEEQGLEYSKDIVLIKIGKYNIQPLLFEDTDGEQYLESVVINNDELISIDAKIIKSEVKE